MRKINSIILILLLILGISFVTGCSKNESDNTKEVSSSKKEITIGTSAISKDVLEVATDVFNKDNKEYNMKIKVFDDAVLPNMALDEGSIDGNFYQYETYLDEFNKSKGTKLKPYGKEIFAFQIGLYSNTVKSINEIKEGMKVAVANDTSNRALALKLLAQEGIVKLKDGVELPSTLDIVENKYKLKFIEMERLNLAKAIDETDMAVVMADVVLKAGKKSESALAYAQEEGIVLVLKNDQPWADKMENALTSKEVKDFIVNKTNGTKTPLF